MSCMQAEIRDAVVAANVPQIRSTEAGLPIVEADPADDIPRADWKTIDQALSHLGRRRAEQDYEEGRWLVAAQRTAAHQRFGFATLSEYVERRLGHDPHTTAERLRIAKALTYLPGTRAALREGRLFWSAAKELTRVAVPETEQAWLDAARTKSVRQIEALVAGHRPGDRPQDPRDPRLKKHVVRLELAPEVFARFRDAIDRTRREVDPNLSDEQALDDILQRALAGGDDGRGRYQVALTVCEGCGRTWQDSRGEAIEVSSEVAELAACDGDHLGMLVSHVGADPNVRTTRARGSIPPAVRRTVMRRDHGRCTIPGCQNTGWLDVHHIEMRSVGGRSDPEGLILLCGTHHRLHHQGLIVIEGSPSTGLRFSHADGTPYGGPAVPANVEAYREAFDALRKMGLHEARVRAMLGAARSHVGPRATAEDLVTAALMRSHRRPPPSTERLAETVRSSHVGSETEPGARSSSSTGAERSYSDRAVGKASEVHENRRGYGPTGAPPRPSWASRTCRNPPRTEPRAVPALGGPLPP